MKCLEIQADQLQNISRIEGGNITKGRSGCLQYSAVFAAECSTSHEKNHVC